MALSGYRDWIEREGEAWRKQEREERGHYPRPCVAVVKEEHADGQQKREAAQGGVGAGQDAAVAGGGDAPQQSEGTADGSVHGQVPVLRVD